MGTAAHVPKRHGHGKTNASGSTTVVEGILELALLAKSGSDGPNHESSE